jgi:hypothetical protein
MKQDEFATKLRNNGAPMGLIRVVLCAQLGFAGALGCASEPGAAEEELVATKSARMSTTGTPEEMLAMGRIFGFEDPTLWTDAREDPTREDAHVEGRYSLGVNGFGYHRVVSSPLTPFTVTNQEVSLSLRIPESMAGANFPG